MRAVGVREHRGPELPEVVDLASEARRMPEAGGVRGRKVIEL